MLTVWVCERKALHVVFAPKTLAEMTNEKTLKKVIIIIYFFKCYIKEPENKLKSKKWKRISVSAGRVCFCGFLKQDSSFFSWQAARWPGGGLALLHHSKRVRGSSPGRGLSVWKYSFM